MRIERVDSARHGSGWRFRFVDPLTRKRTSKTFWTATKEAAVERFGRHMRKLRNGRGWRATYETLVKRFLAEAEIASEDRRQLLSKWLERNPLGIVSARDLKNRRELKRKARALIGQRLDIPGRKRASRWSVHGVWQGVQKPLKQLAAWAASDGVIPYDPLQRWKKSKHAVYGRRATFRNPGEIHEILAAALEMDSALNHGLPASIPILALLLTANRPKTVFAARIADLDRQACRLELPEGEGNKRNGAAALTPEFLALLDVYLERRGNPAATESLFVAPTGGPIDRNRFSKYFRRCQVLAAVRKFWPGDAPAGVEPLDVAHAVYYGRPRGKDGPRPKRQVKLNADAARAKSIRVMAEKLGPLVEAEIGRRTLYSLKHTHITWARRQGLYDAARAQAGHAGKDVHERHYADPGDPRGSDQAALSAQAVWDILNGKKFLPGQAPQRREHGPKVIPLAKAAGAEGMSGDHGGDHGAGKRGRAKKRDAASAREDKELYGVPGRIRTFDLYLRRILHNSTA